MVLTLKQWRFIKELTQEEMAKKCDVHRHTYASWEEKPEEISIKNAKIISKALGESIDDIFFAKDSTNCREK